MTFKDYLISRRIDPSAFAKNEPRRYREFGQLYDQVHIRSFIMQKLFVLNMLRKNYPYSPSEEEAVSAGKKSAGSSGKRPLMRPRPTVLSPDTAKETPEVKRAKPAIKPRISKKSDPDSGKKAAPVIRPKQSESTASTKPKIKPVIKPKSQTAESGQKKKPARPVIKPRPKSD
jgi:hypothetical protein